MNNKKDNLLLFSILGKPGSGKDTQAAFLTDYFNLNNIETSTLINQRFDKDHSPEIAEHRKIFEAGGLLDSFFVLSILQDHIDSLFQEDKIGGGIVFGGSPRKLYEAENLMVIAEEYFKLENIFCIYLDIPDDVGIERIIKRNARPLDRDRNVLKFRMEEFYNHTMPVVQYFKNKGMVFEVDGTLGEDEVFRVIREYLSNKINK